MGLKYLEYLSAHDDYNGYDYFKKDKVKDVVVDGNKFSAKVQGTRLYKASVTIVDDELVDWECNCPSDHKICKHVVALLYKISGDDQNEFYERNHSPFLEKEEDKYKEIKISKELKEKIKNLDKKYLIEIVEFLASNNGNFPKNDLIRYIDNHTTTPFVFNEKTYKHYLKQLKDINDGKLTIKILKDYDRYDSYGDYDYEEYDKYNINEKVLETCLYALNLYKNGFYKEAADLSFHLLVMSITREDGDEWTSDSIYSLNLRFDVDEIVDIYLSSIEKGDCETSQRVFAVYFSIGYHLKERHFLSKNPKIISGIKKYLEELVEKRPRYLEGISFYLEIFKNDLEFFKYLLEIDFNCNKSLISYFPPFLKSYPKEKQEEILSYFLDIINLYGKESAECFFKISEILRNNGLDYDYYLFKSYEKSKEIKYLLAIYFDPPSFIKYVDKIKEISESNKNSLIDFLLGNTTYKSLLSLNINSFYHGYSYETILTILLFLFNLNKNLYLIINYNTFKKMCSRFAYFASLDFENYGEIINKFKSSYKQVMKNPSINYKELYLDIHNFIKARCEGIFDKEIDGDRDLIIEYVNLIDNIGSDYNLHPRLLYLEMKNKYRRFKPFRGT